MARMSTLRTQIVIIKRRDAILKLPDLTRLIASAQIFVERLPYADFLFVADSMRVSSLAQLLREIDSTFRRTAEEERKERRKRKIIDRLCRVGWNPLAPKGGDGDNDPQHERERPRKIGEERA